MPIFICFTNIAINNFVQVKDLLQKFCQGKRAEGEGGGDLAARLDKLRQGWRWRGGCCHQADGGGQH